MKFRWRRHCWKFAGRRSTLSPVKDELGWKSVGWLLPGTKVGSRSAGENPVASALLEVLG